MSDSCVPLQDDPRSSLGCFAELLVLCNPLKEAATCPAPGALCGARIRQSHHLRGAAQMPKITRTFW